VENIEDLFSLAAASGQYPLANSVSTAIAATLAYATTAPKQPEIFLSVKHGLHTPENWELRLQGDEVSKYMAPFYDLYAGLLTGRACGIHAEMRNTVITFNYDTVLEDALSNWNLESWYGFDSDSVEYDDSCRFLSENDADRVLPILKITWIGKLGGSP